MSGGEGMGPRRVRHPTYGMGSIVARERGGLVLRVRFDRFPGLDVGLPANLLRLVEDEEGTLGGGRRGRTTGRTRSGEEDSRFQPDRQILEALRLGVVPSKGLEAYTVGRENEIAAFRMLLSGGERGRALALLGDYGSGKTHMLELCQRWALDEGWIVARAWLDPQEAPPNRPRRVYAALARSLVYPDRIEAGEQGLWPLLSGEAGRGGDDPLRDFRGEAHAFLEPARRYAEALAEALREHPEDARPADLQSRLLDWIEGRATGINQELQRDLHRMLDVRARVLALSDFRTLARVYGYLLSGLGHLARLRGYEGLCVLLDETELFGGLASEERAKATEVFRVLLAASLPSEGEAALDLSGIGEGGRGVIRRLPPRFGRESRLAIVLAATPGSESESFLRTVLGAERVHELRSFGPREYLQLAGRLRTLYKRAFPGMEPTALRALDERAERWLRRGVPAGPRGFARRVLDFLDHCRHSAVDFGP